MQLQRCLLMVSAYQRLECQTGRRQMPLHACLSDPLLEVTVDATADCQLIFRNAQNGLLQQLCQAISLNVRHERHVPGPRTTNHKHE